MHAVQGPERPVEGIHEGISASGGIVQVRFAFFNPWAFCVKRREIGWESRVTGTMRCIVRSARFSRLSDALGNPQILRRINATITVNFFCMISLTVCEIIGTIRLAPFPRRLALRSLSLRGNLRTPFSLNFEMVYFVECGVAEVCNWNPPRCCCYCSTTAGS